MRRARVHELCRGTLLGTCVFLIVTCTVIGKSVRDALFLSHFTALQMTYADLQTVIAIGVTMGVYFRLHRCVTPRRVLMWSSAVFAIGDAACWGAGTSHQAWLARAIYYWTGTQAAITLPQVSMLARQVLTTRQAKRLSGLIGTGAILGWIVGGLVTRDAAGRFGTEALLLVMAVLTAASAALILYIGRTDDRDSPGIQPIDPAAPLMQGVLRSATLVWRSPHLRTVATLVFLSSVVTTIAGLQFKAIASQSIGVTDRLAAFLGSFSFYAGLVSLAVQVLLTSRVLQYFGVGIALLVAPLALATGSVGVLIWGSLSTAIFLKGTDHVLRHSIDRAALDLLYVPLSPDETVQAKMFIEAVVYRIGDAVGAMAVIGGATVLHLSFPSLSVISLGFLAAWTGVAMRAPHGYVQRLLLTLRQPGGPAGQARPGDALAATASAALVDNAVCPDRRDWNPSAVRRGGSPEPGGALIDRLFEPNQTIRLEILRSLNAAQASHPGRLAENGPLVTALAAEVVGLYRLFETSDQTRSDVSTLREYEQSVERICRLLKLISPEHDLVTALGALQSRDARLTANALEYLENILKPRYRRLLVPLFELQTSARSEPVPVGPLTSFNRSAARLHASVVSRSRSRPTLNVSSG
jgi:ATP/ADP translocase